MDAQRIFTFGCSYTQYVWPTWADIIGLRSECYYNWGLPGIGNRAIAERIAECDSVFSFDKHDLIIVQWSSYYRHDWMHTRHPRKSSTHWRTEGSIFSKSNQKIFDEKWQERFWDEKSYLIHTLNQILLIQGFLKGKKCRWFMTSMNDLAKVGNQISIETLGGESQTGTDPLKNFWDIDSNLEIYNQKIWQENKNKWLNPIMSLQEDTPDLDWWFDHDKNAPEEKSFNTVNGRWAEMHPSIDQHAIYAMYVQDLIFNDEKFNTDQIELINCIKDIKQTSTTYLTFNDKMKQTPWFRTNTIRGF